MLACSGNKEKHELQQSKGEKKENKIFLGAKFLLHFRDCTVSLGVVAAGWPLPCFESCVPAVLCLLVGGESKDLKRDEIIS